MNRTTPAKLKISLSMILFGTIGLFVRRIALPSSMIALVRGSIGMLFLLLLTLILRKPIDWKSVRRNFLWLFLSGVFLGFNWILLFESYRFTTVAVSTLCYYMAPVIIILVSPIFLRERLTGKKIGCIIAAFIGMILISGILQTGMPSFHELKGILLGLAAAVLYACIVLMNKQIHDISAYDKTILQLGICAIVLLPYSLLTVPMSAISLSIPTVLLLLIVSIVHTGFTYFLYFGAIEYVSGQTAAIISYIDPVIAVLTSVLILREPMHLSEGIGALLILGAAVLGEIRIPAEAKEEKP